MHSKMGSTSIVLKSLSILLGLFFVFVGLIKISSILSKDLHKDLRKEFVKYAKVFPFSEMLDFKIPSKWYRRTVGSLEIVCGIAMAFFPNLYVSYPGLLSWGVYFVANLKDVILTLAVLKFAPNSIVGVCYFSMTPKIERAFTPIFGAIHRHLLILSIIFLIFLYQRMGILLN